VWATWCEPCREELPHLQNAWKEYAGRNVRFLTINTDRDFWLVSGFLDEIDVAIPTLLTAGEPEWEDTARRLKVSAIPSHYVIDGKGVVRFMETGYDGTGRLFEKVLSWRIDRLLED
jgi:thiol-disulfide isomerase/thioredoxin